MTTHRSDQRRGRPKHLVSAYRQTPSLTATLRKWRGALESRLQLPIDRLPVEQIERIAAVVHEVDTSSVGGYGETEQCAITVWAGWSWSCIQRLYCHLSSARRCLHQIAVPAVRGEDVSIRGNGQSQRIVDGAPGGDCRPSHRLPPTYGVADLCDPVAGAVGDIQGPITRKAHTGWPHHQRRRVRPLREACPDNRLCRHHG